MNNIAATGDLDRDPATPNVAPTSRPPFRLQTTLTGSLGQFSISGRVFGGPPTTWFQLDAQDQWSGVQWPMPAYATLGSESLSIPLDIFRNFPGQGLQNSRVYVGYGLGAYEMIDAGHLREVMVLADS